MIIKLFLNHKDIHHPPLYLPNLVNTPNQKECENMIILFISPTGTIVVVINSTCLKRAKYYFELFQLYNKASHEIAD